VAVRRFATKIYPGGIEPFDHVRKIYHSYTTVADWSYHGFSSNFVWFEVPNERENISVYFFYKIDRNI